MPVSRPSDVDEIVLGHFNAGFSAQDFTASLVLQASPDLRFKRALRVENACATGSAAVHQGLNSIAAKAARVVLVVGVEQMTTTPGPEIGKNLLKASYVREEADIEGGFAGIFGKIAGLYFQRWGDQSDALAMIAAKNHKNGVGNPYAQIAQGSRASSSAATPSEKNPFVAGPLKRTDCSLVSDGAAALVLADVETALQLNKAIVFRVDRACLGFPADEQARHPQVRRLHRGVAARARRRRHRARRPVARRDARLLHHRRTDRVRGDGAGAGRAGRARDRRKAGPQKDGKLPVNPSGGLKAKGHPIGATGVSMHALCAMQLAGDRGRHSGQERQARRHLQHGRRCGGELRQRAGADQVDTETVRQVHLSPQAGRGSVLPVQQPLNLKRNYSAASSVIWFGGGTTTSAAAGTALSPTMNCALASAANVPPLAINSSKPPLSTMRP